MIALPVLRTSDADSIADAVIHKVLTSGNTKIGPNVVAFNLPAAATCPGRTDMCAGALGEPCYALTGLSRIQQPRYTMTFDSGIPAMENSIRAELAKLPARRVVRIHASGDFYSVGYIAMWVRIARDHAGRTFYAYTRSWRVAELLETLEALRELPNVTLWASTDPTHDDVPPADWSTAHVFRSFDDVPGGVAKCPEQTGKRKSCSECGLCWRAKDGTRLGFELH